MKNKSILLVDDEEILLETISHDLKNWGYIVHTASNEEEGIKKFKENKTDLVITDLIMEDDGIKFSKLVKKINPSTEIIILTGYPTVTSAIDALKIGASDYLIKPCSREELLKSIEVCFNRIKKQESKPEMEEKFRLILQKAGLTAREIEVCNLIKKGRTNTEISSELFISINTTKSHIKRIHKKLKITTRAQLVHLLNQ